MAASTSANGTHDNDGAGDSADAAGVLRRPMPHNALKCSSKRIAHIEMFRPKTIVSSSSNGPPLKKYHLLFALVYLYQAYWIVSTMGVPYRDFLTKAEREGFVVMEGSAKMRAELAHALADIDDPNRPVAKIGWFDWMDMDIEEHAARKKREKEKSVLDSLPKKMRVPKRHAPTFASLLCTGVVMTLHLLLTLLQVWSVKFNLWMNYVSVNVVGSNNRSSLLDIPEEWMDLDEETNPLLFRKSNVKGKGGAVVNNVVDAKGLGIGGGGDSHSSSSSSSGALSGKALLERVEYNNATMAMPRHLPTHACVTPGKRTESPVLLPLLYLPTLGVTLEYHRRRYYFDSETEMWVKVRCHTTMPCTFFRKWTGFSSAGQIEGTGIRFGENKFDVRQPTFMDMYKKQLLSPFTVFQLFCVVLWMLDDYWQYSAFTLFMILMFEATVVFSRIKCLSSLSGMGNKARKMMVYREGAWSSVWTTDLLPGDILSLTRCVPPKKKSKMIDEAEKGGDEGTGNDASLSNAIIPVEDGDVVPADILLLRGSTVVNEASLTGESVPQMKEGFSELVEGEILDMKTRHKTHVLYAGTKMLQCKGVTITDEEEAFIDEEDEKKTNLTSSHAAYGRRPMPSRRLFTLFPPSEQHPAQVTIN
jgi:hypothetical protein